jgi:hypothetical protein
LTQLTAVEAERDALLEPVKLADDLLLQVDRQCAAIAGLELFELRTAVAAQRFVIANPLCKE